MDPNTSNDNIQANPQNTHLNKLENLNFNDIKNKNKNQIVSLIKSRIFNFDMRNPQPAISNLQSTKNFIFTAASGLVNKYTIMRGARIQWDPERLLAGKHMHFALIGGVHLNLICDNNVTVDAHYFRVKEFATVLESTGGQRMHIEVQMHPDSPLKGIYYGLQITPTDPHNPRPNFPLEIMELNIPPLSKKASHEEINEHKKLIKDVRDYFKLEHKLLITDDASGKYYAIDKDELYIVNESTYFRNNRYSGFQISYSRSQRLENVNANVKNEKLTPFNAFVFDVPSNEDQQYPEVLKSLKALDVDSSAWTIRKTPEKIYLIRRADASKVELFTNPRFAKDVKVITSPCPPLPNTSRGSLILTTNQSDIVEQHSNEVLTFLLEGANVLIYNNPGKGLSLGAPSTENINTSIEACYRYLSAQNIPDHHIVAKGQCAGAMPTAWLAHQHPNINVFLDQNPSNFQDVASKAFNSFLQYFTTKSKKIYAENVMKYLTYYLTDNKYINLGFKYILGSYDIAEDISYNNGHKLIHINLPQVSTIHLSKDKQWGGDNLVPDHHPEIMLDAIENRNIQQNKNITLTFNPGGTHICDWWKSQESREGVLNFLSKSGITHPLF